MPSVRITGNSNTGNSNTGNSNIGSGATSPMPGLNTPAGTGTPSGGAGSPLPAGMHLFGQNSNATMILAGIAANTRQANSILQAILSTQKATLSALTGGLAGGSSSGVGAGQGVRQGISSQQRAAQQHAAMTARLMNATGGTIRSMAFGGLGSLGSFGGAGALLSGIAAVPGAGELAAVGLAAGGYLFRNQIEGGVAGMYGGIGDKGFSYNDSVYNMSRAGGFSGAGLASSLSMKGGPLQRLGFGGAEAAGLLNSFGIAPTSVGQGYQTAQTLANMSYNPGFGMLSSDQISGAARQFAGIYGQNAAIGTSTTVGQANGAMGQLAQVMQGAIRAGLDSSTVLSNIQQGITATASGITGNTGGTMRFLNSFLTNGTPGGASGAMGSAVLGGISQFSSQGAFGGTPSQSMMWIQLASKLNKGNAKQLLGSMYPALASVNGGAYLQGLTDPRLSPAIKADYLARFSPSNPDFALQLANNYYDSNYSSMFGGLLPGSQALVKGLIVGASLSTNSINVLGVNPDNMNLGGVSNNYNPGNLRSAPGVQSVNGFAVFPNEQAGMAALASLLKRKYQGDSITKLVNTYAPSSDGNNTAAYIKNLHQWTGIDVNTPLDFNNNKTLSQIMGGIIRQEGNYSGQSSMGGFQNSANPDTISPTAPDKGWVSNAQLASSLDSISKAGTAYQDAAATMAAAANTFQKATNTFGKTVAGAGGTDYPSMPMSVY